MKQTIARLAIVVLLITVLPVGIYADSHCQFAEETIRIGGIVPLSAPGATLGGIVMDWGFNQAALHINANCGVEVDGRNHRIEIVTADSEGISERGAAGRHSYHRDWRDRAEPHAADGGTGHRA